MNDNPNQALEDFANEALRRHMTYGQLQQLETIELLGRHQYGTMDKENYKKSAERGKHERRNS